MQGQQTVVDPCLARQRLLLGYPEAALPCPAERTSAPAAAAPAMTSRLVALARTENLSNLPNAAAACGGCPGTLVAAAQHERGSRAVVQPQIDEVHARGRQATGHATASTAANTTPLPLCTPLLPHDQNPLTPL